MHRGEWVKAQHEPLITREQWDLVQQVRLARFPIKNDPNKNFLLGLLYDEQGRGMRIQARGPGTKNEYRYYKSEWPGWARGKPVPKRTMVEADRVESLARSALVALLKDRVRLKAAVFELGLYSDQIRRMLAKGQLAARRIELMGSVGLRHAFAALIRRLEVTRSELAMYLSCYELAKFLDWDGVGCFSKSPIAPSQLGERVHVLRAPAHLICSHDSLAIPVRPRSAAARSPDPLLVALLAEAAEARAFMLASRGLSVGELAKSKKMGPNRFARLIRLNYLAPDIQAAIMDGAQPPGLTRHQIMYGPMPLDWSQQRQLFGFG